jgi:hypothetical protein
MFSRVYIDYPSLGNVAKKKLIARGIFNLGCPMINGNNAM